MPKGYIVANNRPRPNFTPPPEYRERFRKVLADHNGRQIIRTSDLHVQQGKPNYSTLIVVEFSDRATAAAALEQYMRDAAPLLGHPDRELFLVEGVD
jgi:uncharacterized protein (DUF1330 family)